MRIKVKVLYRMDNGEPFITEESAEVSWWRLFLCRLFGIPIPYRYGKLGNHWTAAQLLFLIYCPRDGWVVSYPRSYNERLLCPLCLMNPYL